MWLLRIAHCHYQFYIKIKFYELFVLIVSSFIGKTTSGDVTVTDDSAFIVWFVG
jgi:hypothetical protein